jgi:hypothetical protein
MNLIALAYVNISNKVVPSKYGIDPHSLFFYENNRCLAFYPVHRDSKKVKNELFEKYIQKEQSNGKA